MSDSNDEPIEHEEGEGTAPPQSRPLESAFEVHEQTPDGGAAEPLAKPASPGHDEEGQLEPAGADSKTALTLDDDEPAPELVWYVLKVQSSREDTIRDALQRRVKIQGLEKYFGQIVVPTEKITEIRNNKKRIVERKTDTGYIMVQMELNEKTW